MIELRVQCENRIEETHIYKIEKYLNLTKEQRDAGYKAVIMAVGVGVREFIGSSVYDIVSTHSTCGNKTKAL